MTAAKMPLQQKIFAFGKVLCHYFMVVTLYETLTWLTQTECEFFLDSGHGNENENNSKNNI